MVGTTRFELATSPTPRVRSTRLSHVPTSAARAARLRADCEGTCQPLVYTRRPLPHSTACRGQPHSLPSRAAAA